MGGGWRGTGGVASSGTLTTSSTAGEHTNQLLCLPHRILKKPRSEKSNTPRTSCPRSPAPTLLQDVKQRSCCRVSHRSYKLCLPAYFTANGDLIPFTLVCFYTRTFDKEAGCSSDEESHNLETERKKERGGKVQKDVCLGITAARRRKLNLVWFPQRFLRYDRGGIKDRSLSFFSRQLYKTPHFFWR